MGNADELRPELEDVSDNLQAAISSVEDAVEMAERLVSLGHVGYTDGPGRQVRHFLDRTWHDLAAARALHRDAVDIPE